MEMAKAVTFIVLLLHIFPAVYGATIAVGGSSGWTTGFDYDSWAKGQAFTTKDVLLFSDSPSHSIVEVSDSDYIDCNSDNPIASYSSNPTSIPLSSTGTRYFICPVSNHCSQGMKLAVTITDGSSTGTPPPSTTISPPPPSSTASPPPTKSTSSPPRGTTPTPSPSTAPKPSPPPRTTPSTKSNSSPSPPPSGSPLTPTINSPPPAPSHGTVLAGRSGMFIGILLVMATLFGLVG